MKLAVIIPAFNEEKNIGKVIKEVKKNVDCVIVVDDGSSDKTALIAKEKGATVLSHLVNCGQGAAIKTGSDWAAKKGADIIIHFDADGQHSANDIKNLTQPLLQGEADITLGSRFLPRTNPSDKHTILDQIEVKPPDGLTFQLADNDSLGLVRGRKKTNVPWTKKYLILLPATILNWLLIGIKLTDAHNGLRAMSKEAYKKFNLTQPRMAHNTEILAEIKRNNLKFKEVGVTVLYQEYGQGLKGGLRIIKELIKEKIF